MPLHRLVTVHCILGLELIGVHTASTALASESRAFYLVFFWFDACLCMIIAKKRTLNWIELLMLLRWVALFRLVICFVRLFVSSFSKAKLRYSSWQSTPLISLKASRKRWRCGWRRRRRIIRTLVWRASNTWRIHVLSLLVGQWRYDQSQRERHPRGNVHILQRHVANRAKS